MHIIPVVDLLNGLVVHAKKGIRSEYHPIQSSLTDSSHPVDIVKAFQRLHPFKTLYVADLNAIQDLKNTGECHHRILAMIHQTFPDLTIWVDSGINSLQKTEKWAADYIQIVLGSESFSSIAQYQSFTSKLTRPFTLSLDFSPQGYLGPEALLQDQKLWPTETIAMTLSQVGTNAGVDTQIIQSLLSKTDRQGIYAAGGIRDINDLLQLKQQAAKGALIASALHNKQLTSKDLSILCA
ncbi:MAG: HisA/HisF-related TIM barrel protein [Methylophilaceae bacterium]